jgi:hypothetical protein
VRFHFAAAVVVLAATLFGPSTFAQNQPTPSLAPTKDPQAIAVLTQSLNAVGGLPSIASIQSYTGTGNITYNWADQPVQAPVTVQGMGIGNFRMDSVLPEGTQTWACSGYSGVSINPDGSTQRTPYYNLLSSGSMTLPYVRIASFISDSSTTISYVGLVTIEGQQAYQIHFAMAVSALPPASALTALPGLGTFDLYLDPASFLVTKLTETVRSDSNFNTTLPRELDFANYRTVGNIAVPFTISETINGQTTWSISLDSMVFNTPLTVSVFNPQPNLQ